MDCKIIYCCGDSHTAGGETVDDLLWPEHHPGFRDDSSNIDPRAISKWRSFRQRSLNLGDPVNWEEWQRLEKEQAWPAKLGHITGIPIVNEAVIGSSMEWVARQAIDGISRLLASHHPGEIVAIISPGAWPRLQHYDSLARRWASMQLADANGMDPGVHRWFVINEDDTSLLTRWMVSMTGMAATIESLGVRLILLDPAMPNMEHELAKHPELDHIASTYHAVCGSRWHPRNMQDIGSAMALPRCPDLHWRREVHQLVAEDLSKVL